MPRKPSAAIPRSETTAQLIARIVAERDAATPGHRTAGRSGTRVLDAPAPRPTIEVPAQRVPTAVPARPRQRTADGVGLRTGRRRPPLAPAPRGRIPAGAPVSDDVLADPVPDDTPTVVLGYVSPVAPRRHVLVHRLVPLVVGAAAMIGISIATAQGFTLPDFTDPGPRVGDTGAVVADRSPGGPTVPAPAPIHGAVPGPTVPAPVVGGPAADPQSDVSLTDTTVPPAGY